MLDHGYDMAPLFQGENTSRRNAVPFGKAGSATCGGRMLRDKRRVPAHRRLLAVVCWICGHKPELNEVPGVKKHG
jgi:hypothetical protein